LRYLTDESNISKIGSIMSQTCLHDAITCLRHSRADYNAKTCLRKNTADFSKNWLYDVEPIHVFACFHIMIGSINVCCIVLHCKNMFSHYNRLYNLTNMFMRARSSLLGLRCYSLLHLECRLISNLQSQSPWSLFNGMWQNRPRELDYRFRFEIEEVTLQMQ